MIIALEGFVLPKGYIIKEMTVYFDKNTFQHFHFDLTGILPNPSDLKTVRYATKHLHQLPWNDRSLIPYSTLPSILQQLSDYEIFVAGNAARIFLEKKLPATHIVDLCKVHGFKYPDVLPESNCFKNHNWRYCSLSKAKYILDFLENADFKNCFNREGEFDV